MCDEDPNSRFSRGYLDAARLKFSRYGDALRLTVENDRSFLRVTAERAFPLSDRNRYIGLRDGLGVEIGILRDLKELAPDQREMVEEELNRRYFIPVISGIRSIRLEFGSVYWDVETDRGRKEFVVRGIRESIHEIAPGRFLIEDVFGNRFEIADVERLDIRSRALWERVT